MPAPVASAYCFRGSFPAAAQLRSCCVILIKLATSSALSSPPSPRTPPRTPTVFLTSITQSSSSPPPSGFTHTEARLASCPSRIPSNHLHTTRISTVRGTTSLGPANSNSICSNMGMTAPPAAEAPSIPLEEAEGSRRAEGGEAAAGTEVTETGVPGATYELRATHAARFSDARAYMLGEGAPGEVGCALVLQKGDLTKWFVDGETDAIVNAANERMLGGGGVDGAIHKAAGRELVDLCQAKPLVGPGIRCPTGEAVRTGAARLPVRHLIHAVGPIYHIRNEEEYAQPMLEAAYHRSMEEARKAGVQYIAFPAISCGIYGYPFDKAAQVSIEALKGEAQGFKEVHFILFNDEGMEAYTEAADEMLRPLHLTAEMQEN